MKTKTLLLLTLSAALLPFTVQAKPDGDKAKDGKGKAPNPAKIIEHLDTDGNGTVSKEEAKGPLAKNFDKVDADGNGEITKRELAQSHRERKGKAMEAGKKLRDADTDGNGAISVDEASEAGLDRLVEHFDKIDADGDGEISREEMREMRKHAQKRKRDGQKDQD